MAKPRLSIHFVIFLMKHIHLILISLISTRCAIALLLLFDALDGNRRKSISWAIKLTIPVELYLWTKYKYNSDRDRYFSVTISTKKDLFY